MSLVLPFSFFLHFERAKNGSVHYFVVFVLKCMKCKATIRGCKMMHILPPLYDFSSIVKSHFLIFTEY
jgi:hypothetical protein